MPTTRLRHELSTIGEQLSKAGVPHAMIGAMALAFYGIPRYTADIDLLSDELHRENLLIAMTHMGYECYHHTDLFMQFDRTGGAPGRVDFLLVSTDEGRDILNRSVTLNDELIGRVPVVQPTDYAVLKLMAMANNEERTVHDTADLDQLIKADALGLINDHFAPLDFMHIEKYARRFRLTSLFSSLRVKRNDPSAK